MMGECEQKRQVRDMLFCVSVRQEEQSRPFLWRGRKAPAPPGQLHSTRCGWRVHAITLFVTCQPAHLSKKYLQECGVVDPVSQSAPE
jgi:hypothetical protein